MPHPGDHGGFGPLLDGDALRSGDGPAVYRGGMIGHGPCQPLGQDRRGRDGRPGTPRPPRRSPRRTRPGPFPGDGHRLLYVWRSLRWLARLPIRLGCGRWWLLVPTTPREKTLRPFFSCTTQCSPVSLTRRVRAASPGGSRTQPSGAVSTLPSEDRTVFGVGPGVKVVSLNIPQPPCEVALGRNRRLASNNTNPALPRSGNHCTTRNGLSGRRWIRATVVSWKCSDAQVDSTSASSQTNSS